MSDTDSHTYTINEFCRVEHISRSLLYQLWQQGRGPRYFFVGTHRRITEQARQDWHRQLEAQAATAKTSIKPGAR